MSLQLIEKTYEFVRDYHSNDFSGHDFEHIKRVYANAGILLEDNKDADEFILKMSVLLHDVDDYKLKTDGTNALNFLESLDLDKSIINEILNTINAIGFSENLDNSKLTTAEMKLLSDADKLDASGAIGICRTIMFGCANKNTFFDEHVFPKEYLTKEEYKDLSRKENNSINHFFDKLLKLKNLMQTPVGKKEAQKRHDFMVLFLRQFFQEQNLKNWEKFLDDYIQKLG